jgi:Asp-tRNA(Asn)/Glu-tRNA(Gln) amidotransferase A subunit family amidase
VSDAGEITLEAIEAAERLVGLALRPEERAVVLERLFQMDGARRELRAQRPPNALAPAEVFDPRSGSHALPAAPGLLRFAPRDARPLPAETSEIAFAPLTDLREWLARGELTSVRITELSLERLRRLGPALETVVTLTEERALESARRADRERAAGRTRGPLSGIPWGAKDLLDTAGIATTWGAEPYRARVPDADAVVVRRLDEAGAVLVAKLTLGELAQGDVWFGGRTRNPHAPDEGSGGSSAGSAAAVAAGLVAFSIGSETLGSIANPCETCGVVGLRPSFGRVPRTGAMALAWSLDKLGPIARSVEDTALVLHAISGPDAGDPAALDVPFVYDAGRPLASLRVGYVPAWFEEASDAERGAIAALREAKTSLVELELPPLPTAFAWILILAEAGAAFEALTRDGGLERLRVQGARGWPAALRAAHLLSAVEYVQAQRLRRQWMHELDARFAELDALIAPGMGRALLPVTNATGHPALTLPTGLREGKPRAVTLFARLFDESTLFVLGRALERALGAAPRPKAFAGP